MKSIYCHRTQPTEVRGTLGGRGLPIPGGTKRFTPDKLVRSGHNRTMGGGHARFVWRLGQASASRYVPGQLVWAPATYPEGAILMELWSDGRAERVLNPATINASTTGQRGI